MKIGRVVGTVVSTIEHTSLGDRRLLLCDLVDERNETGGDYTIAVDTVGAGAGETVLIVDEGSSARQVLDDPAAPLRAVIVGVVDRWTFEQVEHVEP